MTRESEERQAETVWNKKALAFAGTVLLVLGGIVGGGVSRLILETPSEQVRQNDRLDGLERRVTILEDIARTNSDARIRVEEQLKVIKFQHDEMIKDLARIEDLLAKHERETRIRGIK